MPDFFNPILKKSDKALDKANPENYKLSIQFSLDGFSFCVFDPPANKFLAIESYSVQGNPGMEKFCREFEDFTKNHEFLNSDFPEVLFLMETPKSTLIPTPLFDETEVRAFAGFNFPDDDSLVFLHDRLIYPDTFNLYAVPKSLMETLKSLFPRARFICHSSAFIEGLMIQYKNLPEEKRVFVNTQNPFIDIVIIEGKNLLYHNSFKYATKEDFIYYIIFVMEQLNLNPEETELILSGFIEKSSSLFEMVYKYVRNIRFRELSGNFSYSYVFDEIPSHYFTNLINSGLCEL
ncbi:MAG: DUF3822 family protein [Chlorobi bacterium]|nr:DUF3822 family protein [Chlorobiota bacterium]